MLTQIEGYLGLDNQHGIYRDTFVPTKVQSRKP